MPDEKLGRLPTLDEIEAAYKAKKLWPLSYTWCGPSVGNSDDCQGCACALGAWIWANVGHEKAESLSKQNDSLAKAAEALGVDRKAVVAFVAGFDAIGLPADPECTLEAYKHGKAARERFYCRRHEFVSQYLTLKEANHA